SPPAVRSARHARTGGRTWSRKSTTFGSAVQAIGGQRISASRRGPIAHMADAAASVLAAAINHAARHPRRGAGVVPPDVSASISSSSSGPGIGVADGGASGAGAGATGGSDGPGVGTGVLGTCGDATGGGAVGDTPPGCSSGAESDA